MLDSAAVPIGLRMANETWQMTNRGLTAEAPGEPSLSIDYCLLTTDNCLPTTDHSPDEGGSHR